MRNGCGVVQEDDDDKAEAIDSYVLVEKEDVLEAIGSFVAAYLAELPQAKTMTPAELQHAIKNAFKVDPPIREFHKLTQK